MSGTNFGRADATHCIHGHAFSAANTYRRDDGTRVCRACNRRIALARHRRSREQGETA